MFEFQISPWFSGKHFVVSKLPFRYIENARQSVAQFFIQPHNKSRLIWWFLTSTLKLAHVFFLTLEKCNYFLGDRFLRRFVARRYGANPAEPPLLRPERPGRRFRPPGLENNVRTNWPNLFVLFFLISVIDSRFIWVDDILMFSTSIEKIKLEFRNCFCFILTDGCSIFLWMSFRNGQMFNRLETVFHYKQAALPRYVLALDKSSPMDERVSGLKQVSPFDLVSKWRSSCLCQLLFDLTWSGLLEKHTASIILSRLFTPADRQQLGGKMKLLCNFPTEKKSEP